jgi:glutamine synthetase adenylyltransferase
VSGRPDISPRLFKRLLSYATEQARERMLASSGPADREAINRVLTQIAAQTGSRTISKREHDAAQRLVHSFSQDTEQTRSKVLQFANGSRIAELVAAMSILSSVPIALVSRLICDTEPFGAMVLCKAIGLKSMVAHAVLNNLPGISEDREEKLGDMEEQYAHMSTDSAERLLGYWQTCQARQQLPHC